MFPVVFEAGSFQLHTYGPLLALAFLLGAFWASLLAKESGFTPEAASRVGDLALIALLFGLGGARIFYVIAFREEFVAAPWTAITRRDGFIYYGGFLIAAPAVWIFIRRWNLPVWPTADVIAPALALGQAIGRLGCFSQGCCYGARTELPWGMIFPAESPAGYYNPGVPIHPTQLYESFGAFVLAGILYQIFRRRLVPGSVFASYLVGYGVLRFAVEMFRDDARGPSIANLSFGQGISLGLLVVGIGLFARLRVASSPR